MRNALGRTVVAVSCVLFAACAKPSPSPPTPSAPGVLADIAATLVVDNVTRDSVGVFLIDGPAHIRLGRIAPVSEGRLPVKRTLLNGRTSFRVYAFRGMEACPVARVIDISTSTTPRMTVGPTDTVLSGYLPADACTKSATASTDASPRKSPTSAIAADTEYDGGSQIGDARLTAQQTENIALLARIWGFVKYHHPKVTSGKVHWDYELFRIYPIVRAAGDRRYATDAIAAWLKHLGDAPPCSPCAQLPPNLALAPDVAWLSDTSVLGSSLSAQLTSIYRNRSIQNPQHYVSQSPNVGNPMFGSEASYARLTTPDAGYRLLALFRFWNIVEYWFPYREGMEKPWNQVLHESIPVFAARMTSDEYKLALMRLSAQILDTHSNLWGSLGARPPYGDAQLAALVRFIGDKPVVSGFAPSKAAAVQEVLQRGDIIEKIGDARVDSLVAAWRPYYSASNEPTRLRDIGRSLTRGAAGPVALQIIREGKRLNLTATRVPIQQLDNSRSAVHDLEGETFQLLDPDVAYVKLSSVRLPEVDSYFERAKSAKVLVIDIRNYPSAFVPFAMSGHLVDGETRFAKFTRGDLSNPGAFQWVDGGVIQPLTPRFAGRVVVLVDEVSQSQAEYTAMALRAAGATIAGSTTAGADGNVSRIPLPGGVENMISGIGVFYPDGSPTQRIGIVPDVVVLPSVDGIRAGTDEVLEAAVTKILGRKFRLKR